MPTLVFVVALVLCASGPRENCVHDGDTLWLGGEKIRIADIDAPELDAECRAERVLALRARTRLIALLNEGPFDLVRTGSDRYGRTLAVLHRSGVSIGQRLIAEGLARTWSGRREPWC